MRKWIVNLITVVILLVILAAVALGVYPAVSEWLNDRHQSRATVGYDQAVKDLSGERYEELWRQAAAYNEKLHREKSGLGELTEEEMEEYGSLLDISGSGIMSYLSIPDLLDPVPVYHGTEEKILQVAIGHIAGSSLPVGGESTHCVLSGHRGLPSAKLFSNINRMKVGDLFILYTLRETLTYQVDQIRTVLPTEVEDLAIREGEDLCTLVTCTPYGINTHRLLVRGHRVPNEEAERETEQEEEEGWQFDWYAIVDNSPLMAALCLAFAAFLIWRMARGDRKK